MDVVACSSFSSFSEYGVVDGAVGAGRSIIMCLYYLALTRVEVCEFAFAITVVVMCSSYQWPSLKAADRRICRGERDVREYVPVHHSACAGACLVVVGNAGAG